jgi:hypothetical protein
MERNFAQGDCAKSRGVTLCVCIELYRILKGKIVTHKILSDICIFETLIKKLLPVSFSSEFENLLRVCLQYSKVHVTIPIVFSVAYSVAK